MEKRLQLLWEAAPVGPLTSSIGSLPHPIVDAALTYAFQPSIPFLPQIPSRNAREYMVPQALEGLPGLKLQEKGECVLDLAAWKRGAPALSRSLENAFSAPADKSDAFQAFEPSGESYSCWQPFLWELGERKAPLAKIQLTGPMTAQWSLRLSDGSPADKDPEVSMQIFRLVLARAMAMVRRMNKNGTVPLMYLDEPGFYCFSKLSPKHVLGLQELKLSLQALKKEGALVGLHCCSNTDWKAVLSLAPDVLSIDTQLTMNLLLQNSTELATFFRAGGRLSLGMIPTAGGSEALEKFNPEKAFNELMTQMRQAFQDDVLVREIAIRSLYTPACGLALHSLQDAEQILGYTLELGELAEKYVTK